MVDFDHVTIVGPQVIQVAKAYQAYSVYRRQSVQGASPQELVRLLLREAHKTTLAAQRALAAAEVAAAHTALIRAQELVGALREAVRPEAGQIAQDLISLYSFVIDRLVQANVSKDARLLDAVNEVLGNLAEAWDELLRQQGQACP